MNYMLLESHSYRQFLEEELTKRIQHNPQYSLRAFSRNLKISPGELSEILRGKRQLSLKTSLKIAKALGLSPTETQHLAYLVQLEKAGDNRSLLSEPASRNQLTLDIFNILSDWYCFALLNLVNCSNFQENEKWIAKKLGISILEARTGLQRLLRVGLLERVGTKLIVTKDYVISPEGVPSEAIKNFHRQMLMKAIQALDLQDVDTREIVGAGFSVDPKNIKPLRKEISNFLDSLIERYDKGKNRTEVYHCEIALFRLTQKENTHA